MHPERNKKHHTCPECYATTYVTKDGRWYKHRRPGNVPFGHALLQGPICKLSGTKTSRQPSQAGRPETQPK